MKLSQQFIVAIAISTVTSAEVFHLNSTVNRLNSEAKQIKKEEVILNDEIKALEGKMKPKEEELARLQARLKDLTEKQAVLSNHADQPEAKAIDDRSANKATKENEDQLVKSSANRIVILSGKDGPLGIGFLCLNGDETRVFASAALVSGNREISIENLDGTKLAVSKNLSCPQGVDFVGIHLTDPKLPHLEIANSSGLPNVGDRVVVLVANATTRESTGIGAAIRGIGPDTWELDAELLPEMDGAPVLSLQSGKVIGVVSPQIAGTTAEWAVGTRHEGVRSFAARLDRISTWQAIDFERFANEAVYVEKINSKTRYMWYAHQLLSYGMGWNQPKPPEMVDSNSPDNFQNYAKKRNEYDEAMRKFAADPIERKRRKAVMEFAKMHPTDPFILRSQSLLTEYRANRGIYNDGVRSRIDNIYRDMLASLGKKESDWSAHLTWYHSQQFQSAQEWRQECIRIFFNKTNRLGE